MLNKPAGCITAKRDNHHKVIMDYMAHADGDNLNPVGRLDKDTEGLIFITNDGKWNNRLMSPENHVSKKYYFVAMGELDDCSIEKLQNGILLDGENNVTKPAEVEVIKTSTLLEEEKRYSGKRCLNIYKNKLNQPIVHGTIILSEGKKRQVKRMLKAVHCYIIYLKRISIGNVMLDENLGLGEYRELTNEELKSLG